MLRLFATICFLTAFSFAHAQVVGHPGGGGPEPVFNERLTEYCKGLLKESQEIELAFMKLSRKKDKNQVQRSNIFDELDFLEAAVTNEILKKLISPFLVCYQMDRSKSRLSFMQLKLLDDLKKAWTDGSKIEDECLKKFSKRKKYLKKLNYIIRYYEQEQRD